GHVSTEQAKKFCEKLGIEYFETSALRGDGTKELLKELVKVIATKYLNPSEKAS
ncbi:MAG: hypothetical protein Q6366_000830, partial [Candidatus Freyarchaeota archaeon]